MSDVPAGIFRAYDIRGVVGRDLDAGVVQRVGRAFATLVRRRGGRRIVLGRDGRLTSAEYAAAFAAGANAAGCDVLDGGMVPTPVLYFGIHHLAADGGVAVTASHNPAEYNGLKLCLGTHTLFGEAIQQLRRMVERDDYDSGAGALETTDLLTPYVEMVLERVRLQRPVRVVLDAGNGVTGAVAPELFRRLGCEVRELYCEVDGRFPNHHPDPTVEANVRDLQRAVVAGDYEVGLGFDGDGDRVGVIDERGRIVWGDRLTILLARDLLSRNPGATVIFDVKCSELLATDVAARGGRPLMWRTGHSFIKQKMREEGALLAGEMSGHLFFGENFFGHDDALYAGAKLLEIYARQSGPFSAQLDDLPRVYSTPEIRRPSSEEYKFRLCEILREELAEQYDVCAVDGVRVQFEDGWGLARPSNTGPQIILRFEAASPDRLAQIRELIEGRLARIEKRLSREGAA